MVGRKEQLPNKDSYPESVSVDGKDLNAVGVEGAGAGRRGETSERAGVAPPPALERSLGDTKDSTSSAAERLEAKGQDGVEQRGSDACSSGVPTPRGEGELAAPPALDYESTQELSKLLSTALGPISDAIANLYAEREYLKLVIRDTRDWLHRTERGGTAHALKLTEVLRDV